MFLLPDYGALEFLGEYQDIFSLTNGHNLQMILHQIQQLHELKCSKILIALPFLIVLITGLFLQVKKEFFPHGNVSRRYPFVRESGRITDAHDPTMTLEFSPFFSEFSKRTALRLSWSVAGDYGPVSSADRPVRPAPSSGGNGTSRLGTPRKRTPGPVPGAGRPPRATS